MGVQQCGVVFTENTKSAQRCSRGTKMFTDATVLKGEKNTGALASRCTMVVKDVQRCSRTYNAVQE